MIYDSYSLKRGREVRKNTDSKMENPSVFGFFHLSLIRESWENPLFLIFETPKVPYTDLTGMLYGSNGITHLKAFVYLLYMVLSFRDQWFS